MRKFIKKIIYTSIPVVVLLVSVNYLGDAANIFHIGYEQKIASILKEGKYVTNILNYDERILQREVIKNIDTTPDIVVIGSSRTMLIDNAYFNGKYLINNSVSGAGIEDVIAIYQIYKDKNIFPKKIIIATDPWLFNPSKKETRWLSLESEFVKFTDEERENRNNLINDSKNFQLISLSYFKNSLKNIPEFVLREKKPIPTEKKFNKSITKLKDGSITYGKKYREAKKKEIEKKVNDYLQGDIYRLGNFKELSPKIKSLFSLLINDMQYNGINIAFFLAPYHPKVYREVKSKHSMVLQTEQYLLDFANKNNIEVYGSFDPIKLKLSEDAFYDGMHSKEFGIRTILNDI